MRQSPVRESTVVRVVHEGGTLIVRHANGLEDELPGDRDLATVTAEGHGLRLYHVYEAGVVEWRRPADC